MGRKPLTHEEFMEKFYVKNKNAENIEILGKYEGSKTEIKCRCKIDGYEFETIPNRLLKGTGCPKCAGKNKTTEDFKQELEKINSDIEVLGEYKGSNKKIKCICKIDNNIWFATPSDLLKGTGCPICGEKRRIDSQRLTHKEFINRIKDINNDIEILGEYINSRTKIKVRCKIDNNIWFALPTNLLREMGCPKCNASKGEKRISEYLDNKNIKYVHDKYYFKDLKNSKCNILRPDFIVEDKKIWIEYDGEQHFRVVDFSSKNQKQAEDKFKETQENDKIKNEYAKKHNWKLIRIPYWDFDNIEKILEKEL